MKQFSEHFANAYDKALLFLDHITTSSRLGVIPDRATLSFLRATVENKTYRLYRGIALDGHHTEAKVDDPLDEKLARPEGAQLVIHTTKNLEFAFDYARGKGSGIVYRILCDSSQVMFDGTRAKEIFPDLSKENQDYFKNSKEVLLFKDSIMQTRVLALNIA